MAGGNVTIGKALKANVLEAIAKTTRVRNNIDNRPNGVYMLKVTKALTSTTSFDEANDKLLIFQFPANTFLLNWCVQVSDLDTGTGVVQYDVMLCDSDGTEDTSLSEGGAAIADGGYIEHVPSATAGHGLPGLDVSSKYFALNLDVAPNAAATTFTATAYCLVYQGNAGVSGGLTTIVS